MIKKQIIQIDEVSFKMKVSDECLIDFTTINYEEGQEVSVILCEHELKAMIDTLIHMHEQISN